MKLTQCYMVKSLGDNKIETKMAYISSKYAKTNTILKIQNEDGTWDSEWKVVFVYGTIDDVVPVRRVIKKHRQNTGDSLPKGEFKSEN